MKKLFTAYLQQFAGLPLTLWLVIFAVFVNSIGCSTNMFLSLYLTTQLHIALTKAGVILAGFGLGTLIGSYLGGELSDKISAYTIAVVSLFIAALTLFCLPWVKNYFLLIILNFCFGFFYAAFIPASRVVLMSLCAPHDRVRASSLRYTAIGLGAGLSAFAAGLLAKINFIWMFIFNGLVTLLAGLALLVFYQRLQQVTLVKKESRAKAGADFLKSLVFLVLCASAFIATFIYNQIYTTYPIYLHLRYHLDVQQVSYLFLINSILIVLLQIPVLNALKRFDQYLITGSGVLLLSAGLIILPFANSYWMAVFSCVLWTLGEILFFAMVQALFYEQASEGYKGKSVGIYQMLWGLANIVGPALGTWAYKFYDGDLLWYACGLLGLLSLLAYIKLFMSTDTIQ
jgi:MFS family permease